MLAHRFPSGLRLLVVLPLFLLLSHRNAAPTSGDDGQFLQALMLVEEAKKALAEGSDKRALKLNQKAWKLAPYNRTIFDELWKSLLLVGDVKGAFRLADQYMGYLNDIRRDDSLDNDFLFAKYRLAMSEAISEMHDRNYDLADFGSIRERLEFLYQLNSSSHFLSVKDLAELNNLLGVLEILSDGKSRHFDGDVLHSHLKANEIQRAHNYFNVADSVNTIFALGYADLDSNLAQSKQWHEGYFEQLLSFKYKVYIPTLGASLGLEEKEESVLTAKNAAADSLLQQFTKPQAYLDCFNTASSELSKYEAFHFLFDRSGSMGTLTASEGSLANLSRLQVMQAAGSYIILSLAEQGKTDINALSIGDFCTYTPSIDTYKENVPAFESEQQKVAHILHWLESTEALGATPLHYTFDYLNSQLSATKKKTALILFSDGINSCDVDDSNREDNDRLVQLKHELEKKGIDIFIMPLIPEMGYEEEYSVYKALARGKGKIWPFTNECEEIELQQSAFRLHFHLPAFMACPTHTQNSDSVCFDWLRMEKCFQIDYEVETNVEG